MFHLASPCATLYKEANIVLTTLNLGHISTLATMSDTKNTLCSLSTKSEIKESSNQPKTVTFRMRCDCYKDDFQDVFCSPPFYTYTGYKICLRVTFTPDKRGFAIRDRVSVAGHLMKGDNDDSLSWPFTGIVTIELLNQLEDKNHHKWTIFLKNSGANQRVVDGERGGGDVAQDSRGHG